MERKIGETFEYEGKTYIVKEDKDCSCHGCVFNKRCTLSVKEIAGRCEHTYREDNKDVVFSEVQEQHTEEPKERKIGEVFQYQGKTLKVVQTEGSTCYNCYFANRDCDCENTRKVLGACLSETRTDNKPVIFVEVEEEAEEQQQEEQKEGQPQAEQQPQKLNLCEILKDCPEGTKLYSPLFGEVDFQRIRSDDENAIVITKGVIDASFTKEGFYYADVSEECLLFPSKEQRDWSKFTAPWLKKERFDPTVLKAFDKVLICNDLQFNWMPAIFTYLDFSLEYPRMRYNSLAVKVIPYNDDTKHLVGTKDEAPEFYKYWED